MTRTANENTRESGEEPEELVMEFDLPDMPDKVFRALTEPGIVAKWLGDRTGDSNAVSTRNDPGYELIDKEPGRRASYRWREGTALDSVVTFSITTNAVGGTRLTIVHSSNAVYDAPQPPAAICGPAGCRVAFACRRAPETVANLNCAPFARAA